MTQQVMKSISDALGMNPLTVETQEPEAQLPAEIEEKVSEVIELTQEEKDGEEDFALARDNIKNLLTKGEEALDQLCRIAAATEQPRAFEIVSTLVKTLVDSNKQLMELHEQRRQLLPVVPTKKEEEEKQTTNVTHNNVFVGTTEEFLALMREKRAAIKAQNVIEGEVIEVKNG